MTGLAPLEPHPIAYDKPLCASLDGFTLHAAPKPPPQESAPATAEVPRRSPSRGPPYWKSRVLRRQALGDEDGCHSGGGDEAP